MKHEEPSSIILLRLKLQSTSILGDWFEKSLLGVLSLIVYRILANF